MIKPNKRLILRLTNSSFVIEKTGIKKKKKINKSFRALQEIENNPPFFSQSALRMNRKFVVE